MRFLTDLFNLNYDELLLLCERQASVIEALKENVREKEAVINALPDPAYVQELEKRIGELNVKEQAG